MTELLELPSDGLIHWGGWWCRSSIPCPADVLMATHRIEVCAEPADVTCPVCLDSGAIREGCPHDRQRDLFA